MEYNPYLRNQSRDEALQRGGTGYIEAPDDTFVNLVWQTRESEPNEYEYILCETLAGLFAGGCDQLSDIVRGLEKSEVRAPSGARWTEKTFLSEMARLAR